MLKTTKRMPSIYTVTPNPALDLSGHVSRLVPNEKNYVYAERRDPGGNGINSARIIHRLGHRLKNLRILALGFSGGAAGAEIRSLLETEGVPTRFTPIAGQTRINVTANNDEDHRQTRLTFPGPRVSSSECRALFAQIKRLKAPGILIVSGSLPTGVPKDFHAQIARLAQNQGLGVVADVPAQWIDSFRPRGRPHGKKRQKPLLFIKPNQAELEGWVGRPLHSDAELIQAGRELLDLPERPGIAAIVCISLAERGALLLQGHRVWMGIAPPIQAKGTVGAGDSLVGTMVFRLARAGVISVEAVHKVTSEDLTDAFAWGMAAGAATAQSVGTSLAKTAEIRRLRQKVQVQALDFD